MPKSHGSLFILTLTIKNFSRISGFKKGRRKERKIYYSFTVHTLRVAK